MPRRKQIKSQVPATVFQVLHKIVDDLEEPMKHLRRVARRHGYRIIISTTDKGEFDFNVKRIV